MYVIQVMGTNGAGKSSLLRFLAAGGEVVRVGDQSHVKRQLAITYAPMASGWTVGDYLAPHNTPGADRLQTGETRLNALRAALAQAELTDRRRVLWEGIIIMTRPWAETVVKLGHQPAFVHLCPPVELAFTRLEARSGRARTELKRDGAKVPERSAMTYRLVAWAAFRGWPVLRLTNAGPLDETAAAVLDWMETLPGPGPEKSS